MRYFFLQIFFVILLVVIFFWPSVVAEKSVPLLFLKDLYPFVLKDKTMFDDKRLKNDFLSLFYSENEIKSKEPFHLCLLKNDILRQNKKAVFFKEKHIERVFLKHCEVLSDAIRYLEHSSWKGFLYKAYNGTKLCRSQSNCALILDDTDKQLVLGWDRHVVEVFYQKEKHKYIFAKNSYDLRKKYPALTEDFLKSFVEIYSPSGGMGNQLFSYWTGVVYALKNNKQAIFPRKNYLENFLDLPVQTGKDSPLKNIVQTSFIKNYIYQFTGNGSSAHHVRSDKEYIYINGYVQSWKNFIGYENYIREHTKFKEKMSDKNNEIALKMQRENSVAIHVRRGDYVEQGYILLTKEYYEKAVEYMVSNLENPHFYVFSNDINWTKENIKINYLHTYVDWNKDDVSDFRLMMHAKNFIIANSTYSWWASFLGQNDDKIIIAPDKLSSFALNWFKSLLAPNFVVIEVPKYYWHEGKKEFVLEE